MQRCINILITVPSHIQMTKRPAVAWLWFMFYFLHTITFFFNLFNFNKTLFKYKSRSSFSDLPIRSHCGTFATRLLIRYWKLNTAAMDLPWKPIRVFNYLTNVCVSKHRIIVMALVFYKTFIDRIYRFSSLLDLQEKVRTNGEVRGSFHELSQSYNQLPGI